MKFFVTDDDHSFFLITDDYSDDEILKGLHIKNILEDVKSFHTPIKVYDSNSRIVYCNS